jgi:uncharacterized membrane protein
MKERRAAGGRQGGARTARGPQGRRGAVTDRQVELWISLLLRVGVISAAVLGLVGGIAHLVRHSADVPSYSTFRGEPSSLRHVADVLAGAVSLKTEALIQAALLLLIAVPIFRVAVSVIAFALERDWLYVVVTALVMAILLVSLLGGMR